ncbi:MAG: hypothetical protein AB7K36_31300 [Chloroflexota bacterium]
MSEPPSTGHQATRQSPPDELPPEPPRAAPVAMRCARDPEVETYLRCGGCGKPICPRCLIQTPVGAKCRECAQLRKLPMFDIKPLDYLKGTGAGLAAGIGGGLAMILAQSLVPFVGIFGLMMMAAVGYGVSEAMRWATRRKQGTWIAVIAALCVVFGVILARALLLTVARGADPVLALQVAAMSIFSGGLWSLLSIGLGAAIAYTRVR